MTAFRKIFKHNESALVVIIVVLFVGFSISASNFSNINNIMQIILKCVELGILTIGMSICIITGGLDLSLGALCSFNTVILGVFSVKLGISIPIAMLVALSTSLICGLFNGYLIGYMKIPPILVTLGTQSLFTGLGLLITSGGAISGFPSEYTFFGNGKIGGILPIQAIFLIVIAVVMYILTAHSRIGRKMYLVGSNQTVARFTGINCGGVILTTYALASTMAFLCAIVLSARLATGRPDLANNYLMQSIAATMFGGIAITGGKGSLIGSLLGVVVFQMLSNGLVLLIPANASYYEQIMIGILLLGVLTWGMLRQRAKA